MISKPQLLNLKVPTVLANKTYCSKKFEIGIFVKKKKKKININEKKLPEIIENKKFFLLLFFIK